MCDRKLLQVIGQGLGHPIVAVGRDGILWQHESFGLAGRGVALRIELPAV